MLSMTDCLFCKIANHDIPVKAVFEDDLCLVFPDINPQAPKHLLVIPKEHFANVTEAPSTLLGHLLKAAADIGERDLPGGSRIVINTGDHGGQTVSHLHLHLLGERDMHWPPG
jgi:histidine triad (HIT) family protein